VFQEDRLLEDLDARGNLRFALGREYDEKRARALLAELGLGETAGQAVREFSGGMKRRLALARALLPPADALALDEPFTGLDREIRDRCREILLREAAGRPVLLVTHDSDDGAALGARLVRL
jgi:NitT/TauT family transport system ATP-binding protein